MRTVVASVVSDEHLGSKVALCPPGPIHLDDGGAFTPSKAQRWLWNHWENYWDRVREEVKRYDAEHYMFHNGDMHDGDHHNTPQIISRDPVVERVIVEQTFALPLSIDPDKIFVVRGTETHVGRNGSREESVARSWFSAGYPVQRETDTDSYSWWHLRADILGKRFDFTHHGRTGHRPWTDQNAVNLLAWQIFTEHSRDGDRAPDMAVRSHFHRHFDSYKAAPTRVIQTPCWQLHTGYTKKVVPESISHIGGIILIIQDGRPIKVIDDEVIIKPERGPVWKG